MWVVGSVDEDGMKDRDRPGSWNPMNHAASAPASKGGKVDFGAFDLTPDREHIPKANVIKEDENRFFKWDGLEEV